MPAAEKSASHAACAATSASEWPSSPRSPGQCSPATHSSRPDPGAARACTSTPMPTLGSALMASVWQPAGDGRGALRQHPLGVLEVVDAWSP